MPKTALIILENPWFDLDENSSQPSVFPFFQGLERYLDNVRVYHATFYDSRSFELALSNFCLCERYERYILYIAAHGTQRKVANIQIGNLSRILAGHAAAARIEGVIIGSCLVGMQAEEMKQAMTGSSIVWMLGYKGEIDWLTSTMVDLAVIKSMLTINQRHIDDRDKIFAKFTDAVERFNPTYLLAHDKNKNPMSLRESISLVIQPHGQGMQPMDMTSALSEFEWIAEEGEE